MNIDLTAPMVAFEGLLIGSKSRSALILELSTDWTTDRAKCERDRFFSVLLCTKRSTPGADEAEERKQTCTPRFTPDEGTGQRVTL